MNSRQWNISMFTMLLALAAVFVPFVAVADFGDIDFGGVTDIDFGGVTDIDFGGVTDIDFGGLTDVDFGGIDEVDFEGGTPGQPVDDDDFDPFDGFTGPFDDPPIDTPDDDDPLPDPDDCIFNCDPDDGDDDDNGGLPEPSRRDTLSIFVHRIIIPNSFEQYPGDFIPVRVVYENNGNRELEDLKIIGMIPEISARFADGPFDLDVGKRRTSIIFLELPYDIELGEYLVRFQLVSDTPNSDDRIIHRHVEVIDY